MSKKVNGIALNLSFWSVEILYNKISPPFEGGVVGTIDYHVYTEFSFPTGVVDSLLFHYVSNSITRWRSFISLVLCKLSTSSFRMTDSRGS
jgi:hypothetical protein